MKNVSGVQLVSGTTDPASPPDGTLWYRSDTDIVHGRIDGGTRVLGAPYFAQSTSTTTTVSATPIQVNNLTLTLPAGTWTFAAWIPLTSSGVPTGYTVTLSPTGAPTVTFVRAQVAMWTNATPPAVNVSAMISALNTASLPTGTTAMSLINLSGVMVSTTSGVLSVTITRTGGTSSVAAVGSFLQATRIGV